MGTPYHHYIIADPTIIPPEHEIYYSEKVMGLPCYQPNDRKRVVADKRPTAPKPGSRRSVRLLPHGTFEPVAVLRMMSAIGGKADWTRAQ